MELKDVEPNSYRYKAQKESEQDTNEKKERVTSGKVSTKKQSLAKKVGGNLFIEDITKVKDYLLYDVAVPAFKKLISESISSGVDMMLYGETRRHDTRSNGGTRRSYDKYYDDGRRSSKVATRNGSYDYEDVIFETISDANLTLDEMWKDIERYGMVSVADMYDHAGVSSERYTDNKYGWTNLRTADVGRNSDGTYYLKLPRAQALD